MSRRGILIILFIAFGVLAIVGVYITFLQTEAPMSRQKADFEMTAEELYTAFDLDEEEANALYLNKVIVVTGVVEAVEVEEGANPVVLLRTGGFGTIRATLANPDELKSELLENDQLVTIKGECIGLLLDVLLNNSILLTN